MEEGWGSPASYTECFEWFVAPYPLGGDSFTDGDPAKAPDVINNSWVCTDNEGCSASDILLQVVETVRAAGIVTVQAAGNEGDDCSTVQFPASTYDASLTVGATDDQNDIAGFSSRGPVMVDGSGRLKPDIVAPGENIMSSLPDSAYGWLSGTSMASPHVAGLVALLISAKPELAGNVDALETILTESALTLTSHQTCGTDNVNSIPNNVYGWGRIDALRAYEMVGTYTPVFRLFMPYAPGK
jgi:subtilisin family serine protease